MSSVGSSSKRRVHGIPSIPAASKKMVDSLKEIVSCPEHEIYAMLKECNMDPNDTVNRLLSQDPFREVKSKREKKKETKDSSESRSRGVGSSSSRGGKSSTQRNVGRSGPTQFSSSDSGGMWRPAYKTENGGVTLPSSVSSGSSTIRNYISYSDFVPSGHAGQTLNTNDDMPLPSQPSSGYQPAWVGVPGQVSMADIVRRGRPQGKPPSMNTLHRSVEKPPSFTPLPTDFQHDLNSSQHPASEILDITQESGIPVTGSSVVDPSFDSVAYADPSTSSNLHSKADLSVSLLLDEVRMPERNASVENQIAVSSLERQIQVDDSHHSQGLGSDHEEGIGENSNLSISDYPASSSDEDDGVAVSSAAENLQQLTLQKEELDTPRSTTGVDNPVVIIPNHLQLSTADYSHLSFGSFGSNMSASFSGPFGPKTLKNNLEESSVAADPSSLKHADPQSNEFYGNDQLRSASRENVNVLSSSQPEAIKHDNPTEPTHGHQYALSSAAPGYGFGTNTQANATAYSYAQTNSQTQNLAPFSSVMQSHINPLPNSLLAPTAQSGRETDLSYSPFQATQSMSTKYNTAAMSSISGPTMPMPEGMIQGVVSSPQPTLQTLPNTSIPTGQALPQHLPVHPYSQPTLPLGHFANMISYPFLPQQSYTYLPYATGGSNSFHQYPAAMHSAAGIRYSIPQYKNSASVSNLPQSATIPSGYGGGYGNSTNIPVNLNLSSSTLASTSIGYEDVIASMKDSNHYSLIQQNEGSPMWFHGPNSRTMPSLPANTYYSFQGQNQPGGFHQGQQQSLYGALGYPNVYQSQAGVSLEHQQTPGDANLSTSQGPPSQQSHQIWQHGY